MRCLIVIAVAAFISGGLLFLATVLIAGRFL
jgi:hypothetical protein